jgi:uncharacterized membrane protein (UPF0127 family)
VEEHPRLAGLPWVRLGERQVRVAATRRARLLGLARLDREQVGEGGLLIPRCASVHTFGMRFALDVVFLNREGEVVGLRRGVPPRRVVWQRGAWAVWEMPSTLSGATSAGG